MKPFFYILFFCCAAFTAKAQQIERRIIIEKGRVYYTTIDPEFQIATLYTGNAAASLNNAKPLAMPAGRNYNDPVNPFCWDVLNGNCYAVNSLKHPMNDQNESLKRFPVASLKAWDKTVTIADMLSQSMDYNTFTPNIPYSFVTQQSKTLDHFFYDAIALNDSVFCMAVSNNNGFSFWRFNGKSWDHVENNNFPVAGPFSLFAYKQEMYMILSDGKIYSLSTRSITELPEKSKNIDLSAGCLIVDKDAGSIKFITNGLLNMKVPFKDLVRNKAIVLF